MRPQESFGRGSADLGHNQPSERAKKISAGDVSLDWGALMARERTFVEGTPAAFIGSLESCSFGLVWGPAKFSGSNQIDVDGRILDSGKIVIATGWKTTTTRH